MGRPSWIDPACGAVYDWLGSNGVAEWLPEHPIIEVGVDAVTYTAWVWPSDDRRGFNSEFVIGEHGKPILQRRQVPLLVWPPAELATAAMLAGAALVDATV